MVPDFPSSRTIRRYIFAGAITTLSLGFTILASVGIVRLISDAPHVIVKDETVIAPAADEVVAPDTLSSDITSTEDDASQKSIISTYVVKKGDTISQIAESFHISSNTIRWANDIPAKGTIKVGQELVILPFSGIEYTVKKGDTLSGITLKYGGDKTEIMDINDLSNEKSIKPGDTLLIPDGEIPAVKPVVKVQKPVSKEVVSSKEDSSENKIDNNSKVSSSEEEKSTGSFINPIPGSQLTQGLHAVNAVDFGAPIGTTVRAASAGTVIIAKDAGYNGGFGKYIVINHEDGTQTLYAHLSSVNVSAGTVVTQGQMIGKSGNTGRSTGPHLHFEVHGATNPWTRNTLGTHY